MTPAEARAAFAEFPPGLRAAMKTAAPVEGWTAERWVRETEIVADLLSRHGNTPEIEADFRRLYATIANRTAP